MLFSEYCEVSGAKVDGLTPAQLASVIKRTNSCVLEACIDDLYKDFPESVGELYLLDWLISSLSERRVWLLRSFSNRSESTTYTDILVELDLLDKRIDMYTIKFGVITNELCAKNPYRDRV